MPNAKPIRGLKNFFTTSPVSLSREDKKALDFILVRQLTPEFIRELESAISKSVSENKFIVKLPGAANIKESLKDLSEAVVALNKMIEETDFVTRQQIRQQLNGSGYSVRPGDDPLDRASFALGEMFNALSMTFKAFKKVHARGGTTKAVEIQRRRKDLKKILTEIVKRHYHTVKSDKVEAAVKKILPF